MRSNNVMIIDYSPSGVSYWNTMSLKDPKTTCSEFNPKVETAKAMSKHIIISIFIIFDNMLSLVKGDDMYWPDDFECYFNNWQVAADLITLRSKDFQYFTEHSDFERTAC
mgnify:CR=1 FL=1